jgi:adenylyltransferase/sulfurtransferase
MAKVLIPTPLRQYVEKKDVVEASGATVADVLTAVVTEHPSLKKQIYTDEGKLRSFVNVYLNDEDIRYIDKEKSAVADGDTLSIVPSIAGGL